MSEIVKRQRYGYNERETRNYMIMAYRTASITIALSDLEIMM